jgi:hypothetical protein
MYSMSPFFNRGKVTKKSLVEPHIIANRTNRNIDMLFKIGKQFFYSFHDLLYQFKMLDAVITGYTLTDLVIAVMPFRFAR